ncbi:MAG TPA: AtpZ/AtpI family protein [Gemmatimonadales bacterium]|nr:AtpZ/AtpI family protein [Gemmatimonadales bacterium]
MEQDPERRQRAENERSDNPSSSSSSAGEGGDARLGERSRFNARQSGGAGAMAGAGIQFAVSILIFLYAGQWLDSRFGWAPWGTLLGVFIGAAAGFTSIYRRLMADLRREEEAKRRQ